MEWGCEDFEISGPDEKGWFELRMNSDDGIHVQDISQASALALAMRIIGGIVHYQETFNE